MTRFDPVVACRVSGNRGEGAALVLGDIVTEFDIVTRFDTAERAALVLGFKELREVVLLTFLSYLFLLDLSQEAEKRWFSSLRLLLLYYKLD